MRGGGGGGRGGQYYKESGLSELYVLANSLLCLKSSGDRTNSNGKAVVKHVDDVMNKGPQLLKIKSSSRSSKSSSSSSSRGGVGDSNGTTDAIPLTLLDDKHPQIVYPNSSPSPSSSSSSSSSIDHQIGGYNPCVYSKSELHAIRCIALSGHAVPLLVHSLCPSIFGHDLVKLGLLLGIFGGTCVYHCRILIIIIIIINTIIVIIIIIIIIILR